MLYIKANEEDYQFFQKLRNKYPDISITTGMNIDGNAHAVEVFIELTPVILSSLTIIIHEVVSYMKSKKKYEEKKQAEITVEKKDKKGEYRIVVKTSDIDDVEEAVDKAVQQIKKL